MVKLSEITLSLTPDLEPGVLAFKDILNKIPYVPFSIIENTKALIISDDDADGITSTALFNILVKDVLKKEFLPIKLSKEEYDISLEEVKELSKNYDTFIFLDSGSNAKAVLQYLIDAQKHVIILDHHKPLLDKELYQKLIMVNLHDFDISAVGVVFFTFIKYWLEQRKQKETKDSKEEPFEKCVKYIADSFFKYLPFVSTGIIADVIHLSDLPIFIYKNSEIVVKRVMLGAEEDNKYVYNLLRLFDLSKKDFALGEYPVATDYSHYLSPVLNNLGRVIPEKTVFFLLGVIPFSVIKNEYLSTMAIASGVEAKTQDLPIHDFVLKNDKHFVVKVIDATSFSDDEKKFLKGFKGVLANKLIDGNKIIGSIVMVDNNNGFYTGSIRSTIDEFVETLFTYNYFTAKGGHLKAGGFTLPKDKFDDFMEFLKQIQITISSKRQETIVYDLENIEPFTNKDVVDFLTEAGPWGNGRPIPGFKLRGIVVAVDPIKPGYGAKFFIFNEKNKTLHTVYYFNKVSPTLLEEFKSWRRCTVTAIISPYYQGKKYSHHAVSFILEKLQDITVKKTSSHKRARKSHKHK